MAMNESDLLRRLHSTEHTFVERKTTGDSKDWLKTVVAFANTLEPNQEGVLFIGATDSGHIQASSPDLDKLQKTFSEKMQSAYPPIYYTTQTVNEDGKECLAVIVPGSPSKPHFAGPLYVRDGSKTVKADLEKYEFMLASRLDKVRELEKWIGKSITVRTFSRGQGVGYVLHQSEEEAKLISVNQFFITIYFRNANWSYSLKRFEITFDNKANRLEIELVPPQI